MSLFDRLLGRTRYPTPAPLAGVEAVQAEPTKLRSLGELKTLLAQWDSDDADYRTWRSFDALRRQREAARNGTIKRGPDGRFLKAVAAGGNGSEESKL